MAQEQISQAGDYFKDQLTVRAWYVCYAPDGNLHIEYMKSAAVLGPDLCVSRAI